MSPVPGTPEPVAIIGGSGALGSAIALRLAATGVPVLLGSRDADRASQIAGRLREKLGSVEGSVDPQPVTNGDAVKGAEIVFLCVPFRNHSETFTALKASFRPGQVLVDATVPLAASVSGKATRTIGVWQGSAAQQALEMLPEGVHVVAALHTVGAKPLGDLAHAMDEDVLLCGDARVHKAAVAALLQRIPGLRCVDAGPLEQARIVEQLTAVLIGINIRHRAHAGVHITGLPSDLWPEFTNDEEPS